MGLENPTYISDLNPLWPLGASDPKSEGDNHLRIIKSTLQATFPNMDNGEPVNASEEEVNVLVGVSTSSTLAVQLDEKANLDGSNQFTGDIYISNFASPATQYIGAKGSTGGWRLSKTSDGACTLQVLDVDSPEGTEVIAYNSIHVEGPNTTQTGEEGQLVLRHKNSEKLRTLSGGVQITGDITGVSDITATGPIETSGNILGGNITSSGGLAGVLVAATTTLTDVLSVDGLNMDTAKNLAAKGYQDLLGGLRIQWGIETNNGSLQSYTFDEPFGTLFGVYISRRNKENAGNSLASVNESTTGFDANSNSGSMDFYWCAVGTAP